MKPAAYAALSAIRGELRSRIEGWAKAHPYLGGLQEELRRELGYEDYAIETPLVYNEALDEVEAGDEIAFVLVGDNPGKKEQLARNRRYLVGQSGKLAEGFFRRELGLDFRASVLIVNKTPVHTPKTAELRRLLVLAGPPGSPRRLALEALLEESQAEMARIAHRLHAALGAPLWVSGYGELGKRGLFRSYAEALRAEYGASPAALREGLLVFRHFSMNQFAIELKEKRDPGKPLGEELRRIGRENSLRILGL